MNSRLMSTQEAALICKSATLQDVNGTIKKIQKRDTGNYTIRYVEDIPNKQCSPFLYRNYVILHLPPTVDKNYTILGDK